MKKILLILINIIAATSLTFAQYTLIPDAKFEAELIYKGIDKDGANGKVLTSSIDTVTKLNLSYTQIKSLIGIEDFKSLKSLSCNNTYLTDLSLNKNLSLRYLDCSNNFNLNLDISQNFSLDTLICYQINLKNGLIFKNNKKLTYLNCSKNSLDSIDLTQNVTLKYLDCSYNKLHSLNFNNNTSLINLNCNENFYLSRLDISNNIALTTLYCKHNSLYFLDLGNNISLTTIDCSQNQLKILDVSKNLALIYLNCPDNPLGLLDVSKNTTLSYLNCSSASNIKSIYVYNLQIAITNFIKPDSAKWEESPNYISIPDINFETALLNLKVDLDGLNGRIISNSINKIDSINLSNFNIKDLTGIEGFISLKKLLCNSNKLTSIDISKNKLLEKLYCSDNNLNNLDLSKNANLTDLNCGQNLINKLDVTQNIALKSFSCFNNQLSTLDVSKNIKLKELNCSENQLIALDLNNNVALTYLNCFGNNLSNLVLDNNTKLQSIACDVNKLSNLDLSNNTELSGLYCSNNNLLSIDLSKNSKLVTLFCNNNLLTNLNIANSSNISYLDCRNNANLKVICLNNLDNISTNYYKDSKAVWSNMCGNIKNFTLIPDIKFEKALISLGIDTDGQNGFIATESTSGVTFLNVSGLNINNLQGLEDFKNLKSLYCSNNYLLNLDVSNQILLTELDCSSNKLKNLDISQNTELITFYCFGNRLTSIDLSKNLKLTEFDCGYNQLLNLNVSNNLVLKNLSCSSNKLTSLDISNNLALNKLICTSNLFYSLDLRNNTNLKNFDAISNSNLYTICISDKSILYSNDYTFHKDDEVIWSETCNELTQYIQIPDLNFETILISKGIDKDGQNGKILKSSIARIKSLNISNCNISNLTGIEGFLNLTNLNCSQNKLISLDLRNLKLLDTLNFSYNQLSSIDLTNNSKIRYLNCNQNKLTKLDVTNSLSLINLDCSSNQILILDLSKNNFLTSLFCSKNQLSNLDLSKNTKLVEGDFTNNPTLSVICVSIISKFQSNYHFLKDWNMTWSENCFDSTYYTLIPDPNFENALIVQGIDTDGLNGKVFTSKVENIEVLYVSNSNINNLKGIEAFTSLVTLYCNNNQLTSLDLSGNLQLSNLDCSNNLLKNLNVDSNVNLYTLKCYTNQLSSLNVTNNEKLYDLDCSLNQLNNINISNNLSLNYLNCSSNQLISLDVIKNKELLGLICSSNQLKNLDLSSILNLASFQGFDNSNLKVICVSNLDIVNVKVNVDSSYIADNDVIWSESCKKSNDNPENSKILLTKSISVDTTINYSRGRNIVSSCITNANDTNTIDAFYTFVAENSSAGIELTLGNAALLSSIELIDTLSYTSVANTCQNALTGSVRTYNFTGLNVGQKYMIRLELGDVAPLGFVRMSTVNNTFSVKLIGNVTDIESENSELTKTISNIYNLQGLEVTKEYRGMVIYKYTDGSSQKVVQ